MTTMTMEKYNATNKHIIETLTGSKKKSLVRKYIDKIKSIGTKKK